MGKIEGKSGGKSEKWRKNGKNEGEKMGKGEGGNNGEKR